MATSIRMSVFVCALVAGCSPSLQAGLANAPRLGGLGGDTPETHVHDVIANGHDSCERSAFPPGEVLRGHAPPCPTEKTVAPVATLLPEPLPSTSWPPPWRGLGVCASAGEGLARGEVALTGVFISRRTIVCEDLW